MGILLFIKSITRRSTRTTFLAAPQKFDSLVGSREQTARLTMQCWPGRTSRFSVDAQIGAGCRAGKVIPSWCVGMAARFPGSSGRVVHGVACLDRGKQGGNGVLRARVGGQGSRGFPHGLGRYAVRVDVTAGHANLSLHE